MATASVPPITRFEPCAACLRHIRAQSPVCPFCEASRALSAAPALGAAGRLSRAAVLSLGAAAALADCDPPVAPPYGSPPIRVDVPPTDGTGTCTTIGCAASLSIEFTRIGAWTAGLYRFDVDTLGPAQRCEIALPLRCDTPPRCDGDGSWTLTTSGCALDPSQHAITGITFRSPTAPRRVVMTAYQDGRPSGSVDLAVEYQTSRPNGPTCEPLCFTTPPRSVTLSP
jgi:hypothetical protein